MLQKLLSCFPYCPPLPPTWPSPLLQGYSNDVCDLEDSAVVLLNKDSQDTHTHGVPVWGQIHSAAVSSHESHTLPCWTQVRRFLLHYFPHAAGESAAPGMNHWFIRNKSIISAQCDHWFNVLIRKVCLLDQSNVGFWWIIMDYDTNYYNILMSFIMFALYCI